MFYYLAKCGWLSDGFFSVPFAASDSTGSEIVDTRKHSSACENTFQ